MMGQYREPLYPDYIIPGAPGIPQMKIVFQRGHPWHAKTVQSSEAVTVLNLALAQFNGHNPFAVVTAKGYWWSGQPAVQVGLDMVVNSQTELAYGLAVRGLNGLKTWLGQRSAFEPVPMVLYVGQQRAIVMQFNDLQSSSSS